ncbi:hypothetical protein EON65_29040 [archaeon]|nr:MAG: hypothetical protein EON65_29040 [archaeon]
MSEQEVADSVDDVVDYLGVEEEGMAVRSSENATCTAEDTVENPEASGGSKARLEIQISFVTKKVSLIITE